MLQTLTCYKLETSGGGFHRSKYRVSFVGQRGRQTGANVCGVLLVLIPRKIAH